MHRIPLQLPIPSVMWERSLPECVLFERTLNIKNVLETEAFILALDEECEFNESQSYGIAEDIFLKAKNFFLASDPVSFTEALYKINSLILRAPKNSGVLSCALKIRGHLFYHDSRLENASNDYEMYLYVNQFNKNAQEDVCEVVGYLTICMYMMRQHSKAKKYLSQYNKYKAKLPSNVFNVHSFDQIDKHINNFINELNDARETMPKLKPLSNIPFKKCSVSSGTDDTIHIQCDLQKADTIFIEDPMLHSIKAPFVRCEVCYRLSKIQMYTCLDCRYKNYCSLECLEKDKTAHAGGECMGYKQLLLIILDAGVIFRIFVNIAKYLSEFIFNEVIFEKNITALEVWFNLLEIVNEKNENGSNCHNYLSVITTKPLYNNLTKTQYSTLVATAFRLAIFLDTKTNLIEMYFSRLQISSKQKLIIVGSLLMRIHCNILLNTFDFELRNDTFDQQAFRDTEHVKRLVTSSSPKHEHLIKDLNDFYDVDIETDIWQRSLQILKATNNFKEITLNTLPSLQNTQKCNHIYHILSVFKDNIAELYFNPELIHNVLYSSEVKHQVIKPIPATMICKRLGEMTSVQRCYFVKKFARLFHNHYTEYFMQISDNSKIHHVLSAYLPTLRQFKHSCDPNVEIIVLDDGSIAGKALRNIKCGEPLYVAFKAHYMRHSYKERQQFLQQLNIKCQCKYCKLGNLDDPVNLRQVIYCECCTGIEITPAMNVCPKCCIQYKNLLIKYRTVLNVIQNELSTVLKYPKMNHRDIYILHLMMYLHAKKYFGPHNEYRINIELKHARYLALKNYANQSYQLIMEIRNKIIENHAENFIWFTYYAEMLPIIKTILCFNNEKRLYPISSKILLILCNLGLHIVKGQTEHLQLYEIFDRKCPTILEDLSALLRWKNELVCKPIVPIIDTLKIPSIR